VLFDGGFGATVGDVYQARVDVRGGTTGIPWRMLRGPREDYEPALRSSGDGFGFTWIAREERGRRSILYGQALNRWSAPTGLAVRLIDTTLLLNAPRVTWTGAEWVFTCLSAQGEAMAVDFMRLDTRSKPHGVLQHISPDRIGGTETENRYDVAWDGDALGVVWSELREGASQVFFRRVSERGNALGPDARVSPSNVSAAEPALVPLGMGLFAVAMRVDREGVSRVWVQTIDGEGVAQRSHVELQGSDGMASSPSLLYDGQALVVATVSARGISMHRLGLAPCGRWE
jgi:hypothetical protein